MGALQPWHWIVLLVVVLLLFGSSRLPGLAKSVGQSMKIFKKEVSELRDDKSDKSGAATFEGRSDATSRIADGAAADRPTDTQTGTSPNSLTDKGGDAPKA